MDREQRKRKERLMSVDLFLLLERLDLCDTSSLHLLAIYWAKKQLEDYYKGEQYE